MKSNLDMPSSQEKPMQEWKITRGRREDEDHYETAIYPISHIINHIDQNDGAIEYGHTMIEADSKAINRLLAQTKERAVKKCVEIVEEEIAGGDQTEWKEDPMSKLEKRGRIVGLGERIISRLQSLKPNK